MEEKKNHSNDPNATQPIDEQGRYTSDGQNKSSNKTAPETNVGSPLEEPNDEFEDNEILSLSDDISDEWEDDEEEQAMKLFGLSEEKKPANKAPTIKENGVDAVADYVLEQLKSGGFKTYSDFVNYTSQLAMQGDDFGEVVDVLKTKDWNTYYNTLERLSREEEIQRRDKEKKKEQAVKDWLKGNPISFKENSSDEEEDDMEEEEEVDLSVSPHKAYGKKIDRIAFKMNSDQTGYNLLVNGVKTGVYIDGDKERGFTINGMDGMEYNGADRLPDAKQMVAEYLYDLYEKNNFNLEALAKSERWNPNQD